MVALPEWMLALPEEGVTAEEYDRMPEEICMRIEIVDGSIIVSPSTTPRHNRIARLLANALEAAIPAPWQVTTDVDLRLSDVPLHNRRPDRVLATNVEFWAAIMLDFAEVPAHMFTSMFTCARTAGWSAHILEQKRTGRLVRPSARYVGPAARGPREIEGYDSIAH